VKATKKAADRFLAGGRAAGAGRLTHLDDQDGRVAAIDVQPLTTERFADLAELFNEGGDPKWCWCQYFRKAGLDWTNSTTAGNRAALESLAARPDLAPGLVGYRDGRVVGWVSLAPREDYGRLENAKVLARVDDTPVWSIVCFVVSRKARGQGVATALLDGAIAYAREHRATMLEAYPVAATRGRISPASAFHGVQSMYEKAGFAVVATRQWNETSPIRPIMRLALGAQGRKR
jgi:GNAT superfamily N-acetyltransferase